VNVVPDLLLVDLDGGVHAAHRCPPTPAAAREGTVTRQGLGMTSLADREMQEIEAANTSSRRMYHLIGQPGPIGDRRFKIKFLDARVEAFGFTFGLEKGMDDYV
jgi:hypothetical protein